MNDRVFAVLCRARASLQYVAGDSLRSMDNPLSTNVQDGFPMSMAKNRYPPTFALPTPRPLLSLRHDLRRLGGTSPEVYGVQECRKWAAIDTRGHP